MYTMENVHSALIWSIGRGLSCGGLFISDGGGSSTGLLNEKTFAYSDFITIRLQ